MDDEEQRRCVACGRMVVRRRDSWAVDDGTAWFFTCTQILVDGRLVEAAYHYVEGETQRVWVVRGDTLVAGE